MSRSILTLVLLASLTFFLGLGRQAISDSDEGYYAEAAREMVESGDWLTPHFNYDYRWEKPVLYYWLTSTAYLVIGPTEFAARFWSAASGLGLVLLTWAAAKHATRDSRTAWLAGAIVATCFGYFAEARLALPDLPLAFCITLGIYSVFRAADPLTPRTATWWALAGLGAGLGFLMKGPIALVVPGVVLLPIAWRERKTLQIPPRGVATGLAIFALVGLPWYVAMTLTHGRAYLESFFLSDNLQRFATDKYQAAPRPLWFYLPILIGGLMPWTAYLIALPTAYLADRGARARRRLTAVDWRFLLWAAMPFLFFTASIGKQPRYILPVLPPVAILLAQAMTSRLGIRDAAAGEHTGVRMGAADGGPGHAFTIATWTTVALLAVLALLLWRARPLLVAASPMLTTAAILSLLAAATILGATLLTGAWRRLPGTLAGCAAVLLLAVQFGALAGVRPEPVEQMAALVDSQRTASEPVGEYRAFVRNLVFYTGYKQIELFNAPQVVTYLQSPARVLLVVRALDLPDIEAALGARTHVLGQVTYLDPARIKLHTFIWPDPARALDRVLLVSNR